MTASPLPTGRRDPTDPADPATTREGTSGAPRVGREFLLFAASEPDLGQDLVAPIRPIERMIAWGPPRTSPPDPMDRLNPDGSFPRYFPGEQGRAVRLALEIAASLHRSVRLIDVNLPDDSAPEVARFVTADTLLPLLVAPSGLRLEGTDGFVPSRLRRFLRG